MSWQLVRLLSLLAAVGSAAPILLYIFSARFRRLTCPPGQEPRTLSEEPGVEPQKSQAYIPGLKAAFQNIGDRLRAGFDRLVDAAIIAFSLVGGYLVADHFRLHPVNAALIGLGLAALLIYLRRGYSV